MVAIAQRGLSSSDPVTKLILATFLTIDHRDGSPRQLDNARTFFADAIADGENCDFLAMRLGDKGNDRSLPQPGNAGDLDNDAVEDPLGVGELPGNFPDPDGALPAPGDEPEVGPVADAP